MKGLTDDRSKIIRKAYSRPEIIDEEDFVSMDWDGLTTSAIKTGESIYAPDVHKDPRYRAGDENTQSEFVVPLQAYGENIGVINMESPKLDDFSERTRRLVSTFAQNATLAIQNAKLLATLEASVASLRESQSRINFFLEHTAEGVYRIDYDPPIPIDLPIEKQFRLSVEHGKIAECNVAFANMYGLSTREEMIGKPYIEFMAKEDTNPTWRGIWNLCVEAIRSMILKPRSSTSKEKNYILRIMSLGSFVMGYLYFFYISWGSSNWASYWVKADFIEKLRPKD